MKRIKVLKDLKTALYYSGKIIYAFSYILLVPLFVAAIFKEWHMFFSFLFTLGITFFVTGLLEVFFKTEKELNWLGGMLVVVVTWLIVNSISALPCYMSGFYGSYIDGFFDTMSGFTTTGLSVIQDLDHAPYSLHMWRHLMQYVGGQGIIVLALIFLARSLRGAVKTYFGEAREERLWPNIKATAASIWKIASIYLVLGTLVLFAVFLNAGVVPVDAFFHALWITMSGWATGGFAPSSLSVLAYHSFLAELAILLIMFLGSMNFVVHFVVWKGKLKELIKNTELNTYIIYFVFSYFLVFLSLATINFYAGTLSNFRFAFFQVASAVTGTGYTNVSPAVLINFWSELAIFGVALAMTFGPCSCSTAGGIKAMRVALGVKGIYHEIKRIILPENSIIFTYYHHLRRNSITDNQVKMAALIAIAYICTYIAGALVGTFYGNSFLLSLYESISATANVGLSVGITSATMPAALKLTYIIQMWLGRLEFTALLALIGYAVVLVRGK